MAVVDDYVTLTLLGSSAFFVALSIGLLVRYRQVSQRISASTDLGRDLWSALEQRMKKQDERIIDVMGRLEVVQARLTTQILTQPPVPVVPAAPQPPLAPPAETPQSDTSVTREVVRTESQPESQPESQESQMSQLSQAKTPLDGTQIAAIKLLLESPKNTRQLTDLLGKSREHTARIMKGLFEMGLVERNDSTKPFVYQLTDTGRRSASGDSAQAPQG